MNKKVTVYFNYLRKRAAIRREFKDVIDELYKDLATNAITAEEFEEYGSLAIEECDERIEQAKKIYKVTHV